MISSKSINLTKAMETREGLFKTQLREDLIRKERLLQIKDEYDSLGLVLEKLPGQLKHQVMVPIGEKAFMPGNIKHTNQVLVAIGDNYFIKCSVSHALGIVERRKEIITKQINDLDKEFEHLKSQLGLSLEVLDIGNREDYDEGLIEIREEYEQDTLELLTKPQPLKKPIIEEINTLTVDEDKYNMDIFEKFKDMEDIDDQENLQKLDVETKILNTIGGGNYVDIVEYEKDKSIFEENLDYLNEDILFLEDEEKPKDVKKNRN